MTIRKCFENKHNNHDTTFCFFQVRFCLASFFYKPDVVGSLGASV